MPVRTLGLPQQFFEHGSRGQVLADAGLTEQDVARRIAEWTAGLAERARGIDGHDRRRRWSSAVTEASGEWVIAEIQVAPSPPGTADNPHAHVEAAIAVIQALRACATRSARSAPRSRATADAVWDTLRAAHEAMLARRRDGGLSHIKVASVDRTWTASPRKFR